MKLILQFPWSLPVDFAFVSYRIFSEIPGAKFMLLGLVCILLCLLILIRIDKT